MYILLLSLQKTKSFRALTFPFCRMILQIRQAVKIEHSPMVFSQAGLYFLYRKSKPRFGQALSTDCYFLVSVEGQAGRVVPAVLQPLEPLHQRLENVVPGPGTQVVEVAEYSLQKT